MSEDRVRDALLYDIDEHMADLLHSYRPEGKGGPQYPALLRSLDYTRILTTPENAGGRGGKPGSRPPADLGWASHVVDVRAAAVRWDMRLRGSAMPRPAVAALDGIRTLAPTATTEDLKSLGSDVLKWHRTACVLLGYIDGTRDAPQHYPLAVCMSCSAPKIWGAASTQTARCRACGEEYDRTRLFNLIRGPQ